MECGSEPLGFRDPLSGSPQAYLLTFLTGMAVSLTIIDLMKTAFTCGETTKDCGMTCPVWNIIICIHKSQCVKCFLTAAQLELS